MSDDLLSRHTPPVDTRLSYGSDANQFIDMRFPSGDRSGKISHPLAINIHGGYWRAKYNLEHAGHLCAALTAKGCATANVEYRRVGDHGGAWPGTFEDIRSAYQYLTQYASSHNLDSSRVVVIGHSAGSQLALCLAAHEPSVRRVVSLAGVLDLQKAFDLHLSNDAVVEFLRGTPAEVPDHYREADPMKLSIRGARQYLIHGLDDDIVPPSFSRDYVSTKRSRAGKLAEDAQLLEIGHAGHFELIDPRSAAWKQVEQALIRSLSQG